MAVEAGQRYDAKVASACLTCSASKGTPGILIVYETDAGDIEDTIWLTHKTADRAKKTLGLLGANPNELVSRTYLENIGVVIAGHECEITTVDEEYNGKKRVRVQWVNERGSPGLSGDQLSGQVAYLFGGPKPVAPKPEQPKKVEIDDDSIPF
jgi:hypothetical protein